MMTEDVLYAFFCTLAGVIVFLSWKLWIKTKEVARYKNACEHAINYLLWQAKTADVNAKLPGVGYISSAELRNAALQIKIKTRGK